MKQKAIDDSFRFQVWWGRNQKSPDIPDDNPLIIEEIETICSLGLAQNFLILKDILVNVQKELGILPIADRGTLKGSPTAYLLGITQTNPITEGGVDMLFTDPKNISLPFQVEIYYDNEVRNDVVRWVSERHEGVTTRLGQPILKLNQMVIHFRRVILKS